MTILYRLTATVAALVLAAVVMLGIVDDGGSGGDVVPPHAAPAAARVSAVAPLVVHGAEYPGDVLTSLDAFYDGVTAEQERAAEAAAATAVASTRPSAAERAPTSGSCAGDIECFLSCTIDHESRSSGVYGAVSPSGTYRGAYQFDASTWRGAVTRAGYPEWAGTPVDQVPPEVQDAAAIQLYGERGNQPWGGRC